MFEQIGEALLSVGDYIIDSLMSVIGAVLWQVCYTLDIIVCGLVYVVYKVFNVFAGLENVEYVQDGFANADTLINVFLRHGSINHVYWDMTLIGITLCIGFAIIAVIKKIADIDGKNQQSIGHILLNVAKSILLMLLMTGIITAVISFSNVLLSSINMAFNRADFSDEDNAITFNDEEYAAMARVLNTVGNYSLNTAYSSRYNVNACFNDIRADMQWLEQAGVFNFNYNVKNSAGAQVVSWQSELVKIYRASNGLNRDMAMDVYNEGLNRAMVDLMETIQTNDSFKPLTYYETPTGYINAEDIPFDVLLFMVGTSNAAHNPEANVSPSVNDSVRGQYLNGDKSIYLETDVEMDFSIRGIGYPRMQHFLIWISGIFILLDMTVCVFNAIARIFNVLLLYLVAPLAISVTPLDDGGKFKQWTTAFVIQAFGLLGNIICMRLFLLFVPMIFNGGVRFFSNGFMNFVGQIMFMLAAGMVTKKSSGIITGILADNAGQQSIAAGDASDISSTIMGGAGAFLGGVTGATALKNKIAEKWNNFSAGGGIFGMVKDGLSGGKGSGDGGKGIMDKALGGGSPGSGGGGGGAGSEGGSGGQNLSQTGNQDTPNDNDVVDLKSGGGETPGGGGETPGGGGDEQKNLSQQGTPEQGNTPNDNDVVEMNNSGSQGTPSNGGSQQPRDTAKDKKNIDKLFGEGTYDKVQSDRKKMDGLYGKGAYDQIQQKKQQASRGASNISNLNQVK